MAQDSTNDMPVTVGAIVVGLIAIGVFYFMSQKPTLAPVPTEPAKGPVSATAVVPVMKKVEGKLPGSQTGTASTSRASSANQGPIAIGG